MTFDQKKAFDLVSREYLWKTLEMYGLPVSFIEMIKCLYFKSNVQININGTLSKPFQVMKGVKQGCPLSTALYVLAINPLISQIQNDQRIERIKLNDKKRLHFGLRR